MKSLAYIGAFALGALTGGFVMLEAFAFGFEHRANHPIDDEAVVYEDDSTKIVRTSRKREGDRVDLAVIIHKDHT